MAAAPPTAVRPLPRFKTMRCSVEDGLVHVLFTQGDRGNPIDGDFCEDFFNLGVALAADPAVRAILFTAEGKAFSFGGDIGLFVSELDMLPARVLEWTGKLHSGIARLQRGNAPLVCAIHGVCAGGMVGLMAGCDVVLASPAAHFVAAYPRIGFSCDAGASVMLTRRMGFGRARRFLVTNETLPAEVALGAGLIDELATPEALADRALEVARGLANGPTQALGEIRRLLLSAEDQALEAQLELEGQALSRIACSRDAREGLSAFKDGRPPSFLG